MQRVEKHVGSLNQNDETKEKNKMKSSNIIKSRFSIQKTMTVKAMICESGTLQHVIHFPLYHSDICKHKGGGGGMDILPTDRFSLLSSHWRQTVIQS